MEALERRKARQEVRALRRENRENVKRRREQRVNERQELAAAHRHTRDLYRLDFERHPALIFPPVLPADFPATTDQTTTKYNPQHHPTPTRARRNHTNLAAGSGKDAGEQVQVPAQGSGSGSGHAVAGRVVRGVVLDPHTQQDEDPTPQPQPDPAGASQQEFPATVIRKLTENLNGGGGGEVARAARLIHRISARSGGADRDDFAVPTPTDDLPPPPGNPDRLNSPTPTRTTKVRCRRRGRICRRDGEGSGSGSGLRAMTRRGRRGTGSLLPSRSPPTPLGEALESGQVKRMGTQV